MIKGRFSPKWENDPSLQLRPQNAYSDSSLKLRIERKCSIKLISVKTFKRGFAFFVKKTLKDIKYRSFKLAKVFPQ